MAARHLLLHYAAGLGVLGVVAGTVPCLWLQSVQNRLGNV